MTLLQEIIAQLGTGVEGKQQEYGQEEGSHHGDFHMLGHDEEEECEHEHSYMPPDVENSTREAVVKMMKIPSKWTCSKTFKGLNHHYLMAKGLDLRPRHGCLIWGIAFPYFLTKAM